MKTNRYLQWTEAVLIALALLLPHHILGQDSLLLSREGEAKAVITHMPDADEKVRKLAGELAAGLEKITGARFEIVPQEVPEGIVLGTASEWPGILPEAGADLPETYTREDYLLSTKGKALYLIGRTPIGAQNAVWGFLHEIGFRQYFPGKRWEIWPKVEELTVALHRVESPSYYFRSLSTLDWREGEQAFTEWKIRNRMASGFSLHTGHAYGGIIGREKEWFKAHPKAIYDNEKFDPLYPGLKDVVTRDAERLLEKGRDSVSMDPSDGPGWRPDSPLGSPSNQAIDLANHVAEAIQARHPGRKVGLYAYYDHSPPPTIAVSPHVIVSVATSFIQGGYRVDELINGWKAKGASIGIRDYMSVWSWGHDLPGREKATDIDYIFRTIPDFWRHGARFWRSESTPSWGANGLGYYLAARLLWDVRQVNEREALLEDYYRRAFGSAAPIMRRFTEECLLASGNPLVSEDLVGRMYRLLDEALKKKISPEEAERIRDFVIYTRYVELSMQAARSEGVKRRGLLQELARFSYRTRDSGMISSRWMFRGFRKANAVIDPISAIEPAENHPLKDERPVTPEELEGIMTSGIETHQLFDFKPVAFSNRLIPLGPKTNGGLGSELVLNGSNRFFLYNDEPNGAFHFRVKVISRYSGRGPVRLRLFSEANPELEKTVGVAEAPPDREWHEVVLTSSFPGLHWVEVDAPGETVLNWPKGQRLAIPASPEASTIFGKSSAHTFYFYVPKGTQSLGGYIAQGAGAILDPERKTALNLGSMKGGGIFSVPVPPGRDGQWWRFIGVRGCPLLMTVPPLLAREPEEGLAPTEAIQ